MARRDFSDFRPQNGGPLCSSYAVVRHKKGHDRSPKNSFPLGWYVNVSVLHDNLKSEGGPGLQLLVMKELHQG
jgi:hypothetical protein